MDATVCVGIDVSKDRLDVHVRPGGEAFHVRRDGEGLSMLVERLGVRVFCVAGSEAALKITRPADLATAELLAAAAPPTAAG